MKKIFICLGLLVFSLGLFGRSVALDVWNLGYRIEKETKDVYVGTAQDCHKISNTTDKKYFIPTKTTTEWDSFVNHKPTGVTLSTCCDPNDWSPPTSWYCSGSSFTQTNDCGSTRIATGTTYCCTNTSWTPATSTVCSGNSFTQTSNCGSTRTATGTAYCPSPGDSCTATYSGATAFSYSICPSDTSVWCIVGTQSYVSHYCDAGGHLHVTCRESGTLNSSLVCCGATGFCDGGVYGM